MQNISHYSNITDQNRSTVYTIEHYQRYITDMTAYINENNHKYTKNMNTLKEYYQEQIAVLQQQKEELLASSSSLENEKMTISSMLANANMQITQLQDRLDQAERNVQLGREKIDRERKLIDSIYEDMNKLRSDCAKEVQQYSKRVQVVEEQNQKLKVQLRQKMVSINGLNQKIQKLQQNLRDRYLQPQKMRDLQRQSDKIKILYEESRKKCIALQQKQQNLNIQLSKYRKQNESLKIMKGNYSAQKQLQIQKVQRQQKEQAEYRFNKLQNQNQSLIYQINQSQSTMKKMMAQMAALETELYKRKEVIEELQIKSNSHQSHKDNYVSQFASLKNEYEGVIQRLEDSLIEYQKKNWNLQQQNNDLNKQLESLQELLQQMKAMNSLNPLRKQYRKMAQLELLSRQLITTHKQQKRQKYKAQKQRQIDEYIKQEKSDFDDQWTKLLGDIDKIKV